VGRKDWKLHHVSLDGLEPPTFQLTPKSANWLCHWGSKAVSAQDAQGGSVTAPHSPRAHGTSRVPTELQSLGLPGDVGSAQCTWHVGNPCDGARGHPRDLTCSALLLLQKLAIALLFPLSTHCHPENEPSIPPQPGARKHPQLSGILVLSSGLPHHRAHPWTGLMG
jgi:hypothetical protein